MQFDTWSSDDIFLSSTSGKFDTAVDFYYDIHNAKSVDIGDEYHSVIFLFGVPLKIIACQHFLSALKGNIHSAMAWYACLDYLSGIKLTKYKEAIYNIHLLSPRENPNSFHEFMLLKKQFYFMAITDLINLGASRKDACRRVASSYWLERKNTLLLKSRIFLVLKLINGFLLQLHCTIISSKQ